MMKSLLILFAVALANLAQGLPGDLDPTFGNGGRTSIGFGGWLYRATSLAIQKDGRILMAGSNQGGGSFILIRYHENGTLDTSFGSDGTVFTSFNGMLSTRFNQETDVIQTKCTSMVIDLEGRIVLAGQIGSYDDSDFVIARYLANGDLDSTFGTNGAIVTQIIGGYVEKLLIQPDGKLLLTGLRLANGCDVVVVRYNSDGTLDETFGSRGIATLRFSPSHFGLSYKMGSAALQKDGKILVAGSIDQDSTLARFNPDGSLDKPFTQNAKSAHSYLSAVGIKTNEEIVLVSVGSTGGATLSRYSPNGKPLDYSVLDMSSAYAMTIDRSGAVNIAGSVLRDDRTTFSLTRISKDTTVDKVDLAFGKRGSVTTSFGDTYDFASSVAIQVDGKIIVAGVSTKPEDRRTFILARYMGGSIQTDLRLGLERNVRFGNNVYDNIYAQEKYLFVAPNGGVGNAFIGIQNDGTDTDSFKVKGGGGNSAFSIKYFRGARNVTRSVMAGTYTTGKLKTGMIHYLKVRVTSATANGLQVRQFPIAAFSEARPIAKDRISIIAAGYKVGR